MTIHTYTINRELEYRIVCPDPHVSPVTKIRSLVKSDEVWNNTVPKSLHEAFELVTAEMLEIGLCNGEVIKYEEDGEGCFSMWAELPNGKRTYTFWILPVHQFVDSVEATDHMLKLEELIMDPRLESWAKVTDENYGTDCRHFLQQMRLNWSYFDQEIAKAQ